MKMTSIRRHVLAGLAAAATASLFCNNAMAENLTPNVVLHFSGYDSSGAMTGSFPGGYPQTSLPPFLAPDGTLYGFTATTSTNFAINGANTYYRVAPDGTGFTSVNIGGSYVTGEAAGADLSTVDGNLVVGADGVIFGRAGNSKYNVSKFTLGFGVTTVGAQFKIVDGALQPFDAVSALTSTPFYDANFRPWGQAVTDSHGNIYFAVGASGRNAIWRMNAGTNTVVKLVDLALTAYNDTTTPTLSVKGNTIQNLVWSETDQALYALAGNGGDNTMLPAGTGRAGTLIRIKAADFVADGTGSSKIDVLHTFQSTRDGIIDPSWVGSLVEDGDWLYGVSTNSSLLALRGTGAHLFRMKKDCVSSATTNCVSFVHTFAGDGAGTPEADGSHPIGPMVLAADGYIYGTTQRSMQKSQASGATQVATGDGIIYRIKPGSAVDRSDDVYEVVHRFNVETDGASPVGLSLGKVSNGVQKLYGATRWGSNSGDTTSVASTTTMALLGGATGFGAIYAVEVDAPAVSFSTELTASAKSVTAGDTIMLRWDTKNASTCVASGGWEGSQSTSSNGVPVTVANAGDTVYTLTCEDKYDGKVDSSVTVTAAASTSGGDTSTGGTGSTGSDTSVTSGGGGGGGGALGYGMLGVLGLLGALRRRVRG
jgi:hypothetical protein